MSIKKITNITNVEYELVSFEGSRGKFIRYPDGVWTYTYAGIENNVSAEMKKLYEEAYQEYLDTDSGIGHYRADDD